MRIGTIYARAAGVRRKCLALLGVGLLAGCAWLGGEREAPEVALAPPPPTAAVTAKAPELPVLPYAEAVAYAADQLFASAKLPPATSPRLLVIDPLVDGATGAESATTRSLEERLSAIIRERHRDYELQPLTTRTLAKSPLVLVGAVKGLGADGKEVPTGQPAPAGWQPATYKIWLSIVDLTSGTVVAHGMARTVPEGIDMTPTAFYRDSPGWLLDGAVVDYLKGCQSPVGAPVPKGYVDGIVTAALLGDATEAYEAGRFTEALALFQDARRTPAGDQLRVHNGLYLANWRLGRKAEAEAAFGGLVDFGLGHDRLALKMLFKPGSTAWWPDRQVSGPYPMWLRQIARGVGESGRCVQVVGHSSASGPAALNERLSLARAAAVKGRLVARADALEPKLTVAGVGSAETVIGTGRDDASDALDRRVEFKPYACGQVAGL